MIAAILWLAAGARAAVVVEGAAEAPGPVEVPQGQEVVLALTDADAEPRSGETVRVVHRPGLAGESELAIGISDGRGRVRWTPQIAGVATVRAGDETLAVRVAPADPPVASAVSLGLLGAAALGAFGYGALGATIRARSRRRR